MCSLNTYITTKMKMTAIYQPVIIACLLEGTNDLESIGKQISTLLHHNLDHTAFYAKKIKDAPKKVLTNHGIATIVPRSGKFTFLLDISKSDKLALIDLCDNKIQAFLNR